MFRCGAIVVIGDVPSDTPMSRDHGVAAKLVERLDPHNSGFVKRLRILPVIRTSNSSISDKQPSCS